MHRAFRPFPWSPVRFDVFDRTEGCHRRREGVGHDLVGSGDRGGDVITETVPSFRGLTEGLTFGLFAGADGFPFGAGEFGFFTGRGGLGAPFRDLGRVG